MSREVHNHNVHAVVWFSSRYIGERLTFLPSKGLVCVNSKQTNGLCNDYEIRYLCPSTRGTWTNFLDKDNPSGTGDYEDFATHKTLNKRNLCNGGRPMCARCRDRWSLYHYYATGDKYNTNYDCSWENGLVCTTAVNGKYCKDYEVQFKCPTIGM
ncbi:uncharacterized protein LOC106167531 [Lingula anatina]|uniref:Uncharacterized protein LOC106167531 n=1 Tax=Lingula anatina TaxID=7574 RepID=A0A1S3IV18_LINAN|nr:uncharacterized protein LOC106167531 [Lingula anatina]|eukprot:XP_013401786.1 uncharacterized protein LOC106167531 [Lingula anatina]